MRGRGGGVCAWPAATCRPRRAFRRDAPCASARRVLRRGRDSSGCVAHLVPYAAATILASAPLAAAARPVLGRLVRVGGGGDPVGQELSDTEWLR